MIRLLKQPTQIQRYDIAWTVFWAAFGTVLMVLDVTDPDAGDPKSSWVVIPLFLLVTVPVIYRRTNPLLALGAATAGMTVSVVAAGAVRCGVAIPLMWFMVFAAAARLDRRESLYGLALGEALFLIMLLNDRAVGIDVAPLFVPITAGVWGIGRIVHSRGRIVSELEARTAELQQARDDRARLEVATERTRLSTELDELLQHRLGDLARLADAGAGETDAAAATATLVAIETKSRRTLDEMRSIVGVMRHDQTAPTAPQPTLTHLDAMLLRAKGTGARLHVEGNPRALPAGVELSAYRVVEHLLEAIDGTEVDVTVAFAPDALELRVSGAARRRAEAALERARERLALHRGQLVTITRDGRAEAIAQLPVAVA